MAGSWEEHVRDAQASFAGTRLDARAFVAHAERCHERGAEPQHLGDLALAWAAASGDGDALRRFEEHVAPDVKASARRVDRSPAFVEEVRQAVRVRLLVAAKGDRCRLLDYVARGPLRAWVGVTALRVALNLKRSASQPTDVLVDVVDAEPDPEVRHLKSLYRAEFREELEAALAALPERARTVLRLTFVEGVTLRQLARLYAVHDSTASRWVTSAMEQVGLDARRRLVRRLALSPSSIDSLGRMVRSHLDLSIVRILRRTPTR